MSVSLGNAILYFKGDMQGLNKALGDAKRETNRSMGNILKSTQQVGRAFTAMGAVTVGALGLAVKSASDFDTAITNAASIMGLTGKEFDIAKEKMGALAKTLGQTTVFSATEAANAFYDLASKGFDVANMSVAELTPILDLAAAAQSELSTATEVATGTLRGFGMENKELTTIADVFVAAIGSSAANIDKLGVSMPIVSTAASKMGVSLEETVATLGILYDANIDASTAATGLRNVIVDLTNPTKALAGVLKDLGATEADTDLKTQSLSEVFSNLAAKGMTADQAMEAFGKKSGTVAMVILQLRQKIADMTAELDNAGGTAGRVALQQLDTLAGKLKLLMSAIEGVTIPIGQALIPTLKSAADMVAPLVQWIAKLATEHKTVTAALVLLTAAFGIFLITVGPLLMILPGLVTAFGLVTAATSIAAGAIVSIGAAAGLVAIGLLSAGGLIYALEAARTAEKGLEAVQAQHAGTIDTLTATLDKNGIAYDKAAMAAMSEGEQIDYLTGLYHKATTGVEDHSAVVQGAASAEQAAVQETSTNWTQHYLKLSQERKAAVAEAGQSTGAQVSMLGTLLDAAIETGALSHDALAKLSLDTPGSPSINEMAGQSFMTYEGMMQTLVGNVQSIIGSMRSAWADFFSWLASAMPGGKPSMPMGYARGGRVGSHATILAGELGPEWARYPGGGGAMLGAQGPGLYSVPVGTMISTANQTMAMMAQSFARGGRVQPQAVGGVVINLTMPGMVIREEADVDRISRAIARRVRSPLLGAV